jgi:N-acetylmuramoyl-L-alanine amidase
MYDVDQNIIQKANKIADPTEIEIGRRLLIPNAKPLRPIIPLYNTRQWDYIVIHHSATQKGNALTINDAHHKRGFAGGMGYHFLIDNGTLGKQMGQIEVGSRWVKQENGAHANAAGMNEHGIGISLVGNFSEHRVPESQMEPLIFLVNVLRDHYGIPYERVIRHNDVPGKNTECPGLLFPWYEFKQRLLQTGRS